MCIDRPIWSPVFEELMTVIVWYSHVTWYSEFYRNLIVVFGC